MVTIGITGASGFVGSSLVEELETSGHRLILFGRQKIERSKWQFRDYNDGKINAEGIDILVHLAATDNEAEAFEQNVMQTYNIAHASNSYGVKKVIFSSTYAVYGHRNAPAKETDSTNPSTKYGLSKIVCEEILDKLPGRRYSLVVLRLSSVFGERNVRGAVSKFIKKIKNGEQIVSENGDDQRQYIHVRDVTRFIRLKCELNQRIADKEVLNVCSNEATSTKELAEFIGKELGKQTEIIDKQSREPNNFLAENTQSLEKGLKITIKLRDWIKTG